MAAPLILLVGIALSIIGCSRSPTASSPVVQFTVTTPAFTLCAIGRSCNFTGRIRNDGNACANAVRGSLTFMDGGQPIASFEWALPPDQIVRPLEVVEVRVTDIPYRVTEGTIRRLKCDGVAGNTLLKFRSTREMYRAVSQATQTTIATRLCNQADC